MVWFIFSIPGIFAIAGTLVLTYLAIKDIKKTINQQNRQRYIANYASLVSSYVYISKNYNAIKSLRNVYEEYNTKKHPNEVNMIDSIATPIVKINDYFVIATITPIQMTPTHHIYYHMSVQGVSSRTACFKKYRPLFDIYYDMSDGYIPVEEVKNDLSLIETENQKDVDAIKTLISITPEHFLERKYSI